MSTQVATAGVNIRDYFLDKDPKAYAKAVNSYEVVLQTILISLSPGKPPQPPGNW